MSLKIPCCLLLGLGRHVETKHQEYGRKCGGRAADICRYICTQPKLCGLHQPLYWFVAGGSHQACVAKRPKM